MEPILQLLLPTQTQRLFIKFPVNQTKAVATVLDLSIEAEKHIKSLTTLLKRLFVALKKGLLAHKPTIFAYAEIGKERVLKKIKPVPKRNIITKQGSSAEKEIDLWGSNQTNCKTKFSLCGYAQVL